MNFKHGRSKDPLYRVWRAMINRCHNPNQVSWPNYGGRGIVVCERWRSSFANFISDMGERPLGASLERLDNDRGYEPANVVWASKSEQDANKRSNRLLPFRGDMVPLFVVAKTTGIPCDRLRARLALGYRLETAIAADFVEQARLRAAIKRASVERTHCVNGHALTTENTYLYSAAKPVKCCKQCRKDNRLRRLGRFSDPIKGGAVIVEVE